MPKLHYSRFLLMFCALGATLSAYAQPGGLGETQEKTIDIAFESPVVIVADDYMLTEAELFSHVETVPPEDRMGYVSNAKRIAQTAQSQVDGERIARAGIESGLLDDPVFSAGLYRRLIEAIADQHVANVVADRKLESYQQQARELYLADPDQFKKAPRYSFTHLLIKTQNRTEAEGMRKILELHQQVEAGKDFEELVKANSEEASLEENGGAYDEIQPNRLDRNFSRKLQSLSEVGDISGPVRTRFGWHLIRLDQRHEGSVPSWEQVQEEAVKLAEQRHQERIRENYLKEVSTEGRLEIIPDLVEKIQRQYGFSPDQLPGN